MSMCAKCRIRLVQFNASEEGDITTLLRIKGRYTLYAHPKTVVIKKLSLDDRIQYAKDAFDHIPAWCNCKKKGEFNVT